MNTLTIDIRKAEPRDAAEIAEVHLEAWRNAYAGIIPHRALTAMINRRGSDWWASAIRRAATVLVVEIGGSVAGYATVGRNRARELKQQGDPRMDGQGQIFDHYLHANPGFVGYYEKATQGRAPEAKWINRSDIEPKALP